MNTDASILVYKFRPERTGLNLYAEYTQPQSTFLALVSWLNPFFKGRIIQRNIYILQSLYVYILSQD